MTTTPDDDPGVSVNFTFRSSEAGSVLLRQVLIGAQPLVLIEPQVDEDEVRFLIDSTDLDAEGLLEVLELIGEALRQHLDPAGD